VRALILSSLIAGPFLLGCGAVQNAIDCNGICHRYQTCFDSQYETNVCETRCRDNANSEPQYMNRAHACHTCLGEKDCASATFNCATQCVGIVP
jgi:hypothetical protein